MSFISMLLMLVFVWTDGPPVSYPEQPFPLERTEYRQGEHLLFDFTVCAQWDVVYIFTQRLKNLDNGLLYQLPASSVKQDEGCRVSRSIPKHIPEDLPPGRYVLEFVISVDGRFRHFFVQVATEPFRVLPSGQSAAE